MTWVAWRLQRTETLIAAGLVAALALLLVPTGIQMASAFHDDHLSRCVASSGATCDQALASFRSRFGGIEGLANWFTMIPGLIGALLAAPFVLDLEYGTCRFAWTQGISRRRWLAAKLGLGIAAAVLAAALLTLLVTWGQAPFARLEGRMGNTVYDSEGIVPIGYTLFALGLAAALGAFWKRATLALVVSFAGYFATRLFVDIWLRQRLVRPDVDVWSRPQARPAVLDRAWVISEGPADAAGHTAHIPARCFTPASGIDQTCLARNGIHTRAVYEPAGRFWELQGLELAVFVGLALLLIGLAAWRTYERAVGA